MATLNLPWVQYALISELSKRMHDRKLSFGKTALQKMVYLLQEVYEANCGYTFTLYTYGPFSSDLQADLDSTSSLRGVSLIYTGLGYQISPGTRSESVLGHGGSFIGQLNTQLEKVLDDFGGMTAKDLELRATIVYADRELGLESEDELVDSVQRLKPHFDVNTIQTATRWLKETGYVRLTASR